LSELVQQFQLLPLTDCPSRLRQAPAPAPVIPPAVVVPVDPAVLAPPGVVNPAPIPPIDPVLPAAPGIVDPAAPAITPTTTTNPATPTLTGADYYSVKWVETWIGGTSQTWVPRTLLFHFEPMSPAPQPGEGVIGMGTLTGKPGQTKTFYMLAAAPTPTAVWLRGVVAAVGAGAVGMVV
jgi:hypothetical protein